MANTTNSSIQSKSKSKHKKSPISIRELVVFALLGVIMFNSKIVMEALPNIHLLGTLTVVYTVVYRKKALIPIYVYVILNGLYAGFNQWWVPYLYIWTILWGLTMLVPTRLPKTPKYILYILISAVHGLLYGTLYAPAQAIMYGFNLTQTLAWIASGIPFDIIHGIGNLVLGLLIIPLSKLLLRLEKNSRA